MFGIIVAGKRVYDKFAEDEMTVYAAQVSFFIILSVVPFIMLLLTAVQMIPRHVQRGQGIKPCERPRGKALVCD